MLCVYELATNPSRPFKALLFKKYVESQTQNALLDISEFETKLRNVLRMEKENYEKVTESQKIDEFFVHRQSRFDGFVKMTLTSQNALSLQIKFFCIIRAKKQLLAD